MHDQQTYVEFTYTRLFKSTNEYMVEFIFEVKKSIYHILRSILTKNFLLPFDIPPIDSPHVFMLFLLETYVK